MSLFDILIITLLVILFPIAFLMFLCSLAFVYGVIKGIIELLWDLIKRTIFFDKDNN